VKVPTAKKNTPIGIVYLAAHGRSEAPATIAKIEYDIIIKPKERTDAECRQAEGLRKFGQRHRTRRELQEVQQILPL